MLKRFTSPDSNDEFGAAFAVIYAARPAYCLVANAVPTARAAGFENPPRANGSRRSIEMPAAGPSPARPSPAGPSPTGLSLHARSMKVTYRHQFRATSIGVAALAAAFCLVGVGVTLAKQALSIIAALPASETATWAMMLVGAGMIGSAAHRQHISARHP